MPCEQIGNAIVCSFSNGYARVDGIKCWNCKSEKVIAHLTTTPYLGDIFTCVDCGDMWSDGECYERPFQRAWRKKRTERAQKIWDDPETISWEEARKRFGELCRRYFEDEADESEG